MSLEPLSGSEAEDVSYSFETQLKISSVWSRDEEQLLEIELSKSRVSATAQQREREINSLPDRPFYVALVQGQPQQVIAHTSRDQSLLNLERGIASLLQLRLASSDSAENELDVSGHCRVRYHVKSSTRVEKTKTDCALWDLRVSYHPEQALGVSQQSQEHVDYELSADGALLRAESMETHRLTLTAKPDVGSVVRGRLRLQHVAQGGEEQVPQLQQPTLDAAIDSLLEWYRVFELEADVDGVISELQEQTVGISFAGYSISLHFTPFNPFSRPLTAAGAIRAQRQGFASGARGQILASAGLCPAAALGAHRQAAAVRGAAAVASQAGRPADGSAGRRADL